MSSSQTRDWVIPRNFFPASRLLIGSDHYQILILFGSRARLTCRLECPTRKTIKNVGRKHCVMRLFLDVFSLRKEERRRDMKNVYDDKKMVLRRWCFTFWAEWSWHRKIIMKLNNKRREGELNVKIVFVHSRLHVINRPNRCSTKWRTIAILRLVRDPQCCRKNWGHLRIHRLINLLTFYGTAYTKQCESREKSFSIFTSSDNV